MANTPPPARERAAIVETLSRLSDERLAEVLYAVVAAKSKNAAPGERLFIGLAVPAHPHTSVPASSLPVETGQEWEYYAVAPYDRSLYGEEAPDFEPAFGESGSCSGKHPAIRLISTQKHALCPICGYKHHLT